jgi:hypothetical protein
MFGKFVEACDFKGEVREVGLDFYGFTFWEMANLDFFVAFWRFEKNEFRAARRFVPANFFEAENLAIKFHRAFEIVHAIARVQQFCDFAHAQKFYQSAVQKPMSKVDAVNVIELILRLWTLDFGRGTLDFNHGQTT